jgi:hypothetical protein
MTLESSTSITMCSDSADVPQIHFNATSLSGLEAVNEGLAIDVVAILKESGDCVDLMSKNQKQLKKREILLV